MCRPSKFTGTKLRETPPLHETPFCYFSWVHMRSANSCPNAFQTPFLLIYRPTQMTLFLYQGSASPLLKLHLMLNPYLSRAPMATIEVLLLVSLCMVLSCNAARPVKDSPSLTNMRNPNLTNMKNPDVRNITTPKLRNGTVGPYYETSSWGTFVESLQFMIPQNYARLKVGELPLVWDWKVESYAQWWAEQRKVDCNMTHSHGPYGENIFWGSGQSWTPLDAVRFWVEEKQYYSYDTNSCEMGQMCGHYTQVVWRDSRSIGCARVVCNNGDVFMTCNYDPPGNYIGEKPY